MSDAILKHIYMPQSKEPQSFTGERLTSGISGEIALEHWHRYIFARNFCHGLNVVDLACGEGYGSAFLASVASSVVGIDSHHSTVEKAKNDFVLKNLDFLQGDAIDIPCKHESADVLVSMETLEHFVNHEEFFCEAKRVLKKDGILIISTPDARVYSSRFEPINHFHQRELFKEDFEAIVAKFFSSHIMVGQFNVHGNILAPISTNNGEVLLYNQGYGPRFEVIGKGYESKYLIAIASDGPIDNFPLSVINGLHFHASRSAYCDELEKENIRLKNENNELKKIIISERR